MTMLPDVSQLPLFGRVSAGFPSPAADHLEGRLDVAALLVQRPAATFFCRASGDSMVGVGIQDGDILVVDRGVSPQSGDVVIAARDGGLTVKILRRVGADWWLEAANPAYPSWSIGSDDDLGIWGVVAWSLTRHCRR